MTAIHVVGAAIIKDGLCLVAQRGDGMSLSGKWEFPGGKVEPGEEPQVALAREIREELGLNLQVGECIGRNTAQVGSKKIQLEVFRAKPIGGSLKLLEHKRVQWFSSEQLFDLDWADADIPIANRVQHLLRTELG